MSEDSDEFRSLFGDVKPVKGSNKRERALSPESDGAGANKGPGDKAYLRRAASGEQDDQLAEQAGQPTALQGGDYVSDEYIDWLKPEAMLEFKRPGVQEGVYRKFRLGKYAIEGRLDLHRLTVKEARVEVNAFLKEALDNDSRCVLILHGKGDRNPDRQAVLKSYLNKWLKETAVVLAFHSAQQQHGGRGAAYVLLKKSEASKERTREQFGR